MNSINYSNATRKQRNFIRSIIDNYIVADQSSLVWAAFEKNIFSICDLYNFFCIDDEGEPIYEEISQWYLLTHISIANKFINSNIPILNNEYGCWWGRKHNTQPIITDETLWDIFQDELIK